MYYEVDCKDCILSAVFVSQTIMYSFCFISVPKNMKKYELFVINLRVIMKKLC